MITQSQINVTVSLEYPDNQIIRCYCLVISCPQSDLEDIPTNNDMVKMVETIGSLKYDTSYK